MLFRVFNFPLFSILLFLDSLRALDLLWFFRILNLEWGFNCGENELAYCLLGLIHCGHRLGWTLDTLGCVLSPHTYYLFHV